MLFVFVDFEELIGLLDILFVMLWGCIVVCFDLVKVIKSELGEYMIGVCMVEVVV